MQKIIERTVNAERVEDIIAVFGSFDENIRLLEQELHVQVTSREGELVIRGDVEETMQAERAIRALQDIYIPYWFHKTASFPQISKINSFRQLPPG